MKAAVYLRSSKDRHDVSIDAQRRDLQTLATTKLHKIVAEFADAVESGKDDDRPGFRDLIAAVRNPRRGWDTLLVLDTSRIARRRHLAMMFERECERCHVRLVYKSLPETDPITEMLLKSILQAMDEWHSLTSRQKGLAGMRENVRQGFRAGGWPRHWRRSNRRVLSARPLAASARSRCAACSSSVLRRSSQRIPKRCARCSRACWRRWCWTGANSPSITALLHPGPASENQSPRGLRVVGGTGFEPVTPTMSRSRKVKQNKH